MTLDQLRYFLEVATTGHLGRAATSLRISPSAISHAIAQLENELNQKLFDRIGKQIHLNAAGRSLKERANSILQEVKETRELFHQDHEISGTLRVAATHGIGSHWVVPAWIKTQTKFPKFNIEVLSLRSSEVLRQVLAGEVDIGFCYSPQAHSRLDRRIMVEGVLSIAVRHGHPILKVREADRSKRLSEYPGAAPKSFQGIENCEDHPIYQKLGIKPEFRFVYDNYDLAINYLQTSLGWALIPDWIMRTSQFKCVFSRQPPAPYNISIVSRAGQKWSEVMETLLTEFRPHHNLKLK